MATTPYTLTCLGPVHIGTGTQFSKFDGVYEDRRWHLIDLDRVLARGVDASELAGSMGSRDFTWTTWLRHKSIAPSDVAAYIVSCPQDPEENSVREAMKNVYGRPYLPGTSVKGAIRTAVSWRLMNGNAQYQTFTTRYLTLCVRARDLFSEIQRRRAFDAPNVHRQVLTQMLGLGNDEGRGLQQTLYRILNVREDQLGERREWRNFQERLKRLGHSREWLGQPVERAVFGRDPNHDLMRAVQVSDTVPVSLEHLAAGLVWTYTLRNNRLVEKREHDGEYKTFAEWLIREARLQLSIRVDDFLFGDIAESDLHFRGARQQAIEQLAHTCNDYARAVIDAEKVFYVEHGLSALADFYADLETTLNSLSDGAFLLNTGWGGGWEAKTLGDLLRTALGDDGFKELRQRYRLGRDPNALFPHTRRIAYDGGAPRWPMGWVKLARAGPKSR